MPPTVTAEIQERNSIHEDEGDCGRGRTAGARPDDQPGLPSRGCPTIRCRMRTRSLRPIPTCRMILRPTTIRLRACRRRRPVQASTTVTNCRPRDHRIRRLDRTIPRRIISARSPTRATATKACCMSGPPLACAGGGLFSSWGCRGDRLRSGPGGGGECASSRAWRCAVRPLAARTRGI